jgi:5-methylcytosine-specific restriction enzyme subunit McrC
LILKTPDKQIIADTKYKMVYMDLDDPKKGISQSDLYQVLAYAVRFKIDEIALFYPDTLSGYQNEPSSFMIRDEFAEQVDVRVTAYQLPVINRELLDGSDAHNKQLKDLFSSTEDRLRQRIRQVFQ